MKESSVHEYAFKLVVLCSTALHCMVLFSLEAEMERPMIKAKEEDLKGRKRKEKMRL